MWKVVLRLVGKDPGASRPNKNSPAAPDKRQKEAECDGDSVDADGFRSPTVAPLSFFAAMHSDSIQGTGRRSTFGLATSSAAASPVTNGSSARHSFGGSFPREEDDGGSSGHEPLSSTRPEADKADPTTRMGSTPLDEDDGVMDFLDNVIAGKTDKLRKEMAEQTLANAVAAATKKKADAAPGVAGSQGDDEQDHDNSEGGAPSADVQQQQQQQQKRYVSSAARSLQDYELVAYIGSGTFAEVTLARHRITRELFAIKKISKQKVKEEGCVERTFTERQLLASLHHPFLVRLYQAFQSRTHLYFVLDLAQGGDLYYFNQERLWVRDMKRMLKKLRYPYYVSANADAAWRRRRRYNTSASTSNLRRMNSVNNNASFNASMWGRSVAGGENASFATSSAAPERDSASGGFSRSHKRRGQPASPTSSLPSTGATRAVKPVPTRSTTKADDMKPESRHRQEHATSGSNQPSTTSTVPTEKNARRKSKSSVTLSVNALASPASTSATEKSSATAPSTLTPFPATPASVTAIAQTDAYLSPALSGGGGGGGATANSTTTVSSNSTNTTTVTTTTMGTTSAASLGSPAPAVPDQPNSNSTPKPVTPVDEETEADDGFTTDNLTTAEGVSINRHDLVRRAQAAGLMDSNGAIVGNSAAAQALRRSTRTYHQQQPLQYYTTDAVDEFADAVELCNDTDADARRQVGNTSLGSPPPVDSDAVGGEARNRPKHGFDVTADAVPPPQARERRVSGDGGEVAHLLEETRSGLQPPPSSAGALEESSPMPMRPLSDVPASAAAGPLSSGTPGAKGRGRGKEFRRVMQERAQSLAARRASSSLPSHATGIPGALTSAEDDDDDEDDLVGGNKAALLTPNRRRQRQRRPLSSGSASITAPGSERDSGRPLAYQQGSARSGSRRTPPAHRRALRRGYQTASSSRRASVNEVPLPPSVSADEGYASPIPPMDLGTTQSAVPAESLVAPRASHVDDNDADASKGCSSVSTPEPATVQDTHALRPLRRAAISTGDLSTTVGEDVVANRDASDPHTHRHTSQNSHRRHHHRRHHHHHHSHHQSQRSEGGMTTAVSSSNALDELLERQSFSSAARGGRQHKSSPSLSPPSTPSPGAEPPAWREGKSSRHRVNTHASATEKESHTPEDASRRRQDASTSPRPPKATTYPSTTTPVTPPTATAASTATNSPAKKVSSKVDVNADYVHSRMDDCTAPLPPLADDKSRFPLRLVAFYAVEIALVLQYLHGSGFIYRDLKPENVLMRRTGHVMLTDFGVAKFRKGAAIGSVSAQGKSGAKDSGSGGEDAPPEAGEERTTSFTGTPQYMSPEMLQGLPHDSRTDWWSYGCLLFEWVNGRKAFDAQNQFSLFKSIVEEDVKIDDEADFRLTGLELHTRVAQLHFRHQELVREQELQLYLAQQEMQLQRSLAASQNTDVYGNNNSFLDNSSVNFSFANGSFQYNAPNHNPYTTAGPPSVLEHGVAPTGTTTTDLVSPSADGKLLRSMDHSRTPLHTTATPNPTTTTTTTTTTAATAATAAAVMAAALTNVIQNGNNGGYIAGRRTPGDPDGGATTPGAAAAAAAAAAANYLINASFATVPGGTPNNGSFQYTLPNASIAAALASTANGGPPLVPISCDNLTPTARDVFLAFALKQLEEANELLKDLITQLLQRDMEKRLSGAAVLEHPFFSCRYIVSQLYYQHYVSMLKDDGDGFNFTMKTNSQGMIHFENTTTGASVGRDAPGTAQPSPVVHRTSPADNQTREAGMLPASLSTPSYRRGGAEVDDGIREPATLPPLPVLTRKDVARRMGARGLSDVDEDEDDNEVSRLERTATQLPESLPATEGPCGSDEAAASSADRTVARAAPTTEAAREEGDGSPHVDQAVSLASSPFRHVGNATPQGTTIEPFALLDLTPEMFLNGMPTITRPEAWEDLFLSMRVRPLYVPRLRTFDDLRYFPSAVTATGLSAAVEQQKKIKAAKETKREKMRQAILDAAKAMERERSTAPTPVSGAMTGGGSSATPSLANLSFSQMSQVAVVAAAAAAAAATASGSATNSSSLAAVPPAANADDNTSRFMQLIQERNTEESPVLRPARNDEGPSRDEGSHHHGAQDARSQKSPGNSQEATPEPQGSILSVPSPLPMTVEASEEAAMRHTSYVPPATNVTVVAASSEPAHPQPLSVVDVPIALSAPALPSPTFPATLQSCGEGTDPLSPDLPATTRAGPRTPPPDDNNHDTQVLAQTTATAAPPTITTATTITSSTESSDPLPTHSNSYRSGSTSLLPSTDGAGSTAFSNNSSVLSATGAGAAPLPEQRRPALSHLDAHRHRGSTRESDEFVSGESSTRTPCFSPRYRQESGSTFEDSSTVVTSGALSMGTSRETEAKVKPLGLPRLAAREHRSSVDGGGYSLGAVTSVGGSPSATSYRGVSFNLPAAAAVNNGSVRQDHESSNASLATGLSERSGDKLDEAKTAELLARTAVLPQEFVAAALAAARMTELEEDEEDEEEDEEGVYTDENDVEKPGPATTGSAEVGGRTVAATLSDDGNAGGAMGPEELAEAAVAGTSQTATDLATTGASLAGTGTRRPRRKARAAAAPVVSYYEQDALEEGEAILSDSFANGRRHSDPPPAVHSPRGSPQDAVPSESVNVTSLPENTASATPPISAFANVEEAMAAERPTASQESNQTEALPLTEPSEEVDAQPPSTAAVAEAPSALETVAAASPVAEVATLAATPEEKKDEEAGEAGEAGVPPVIPRSTAPDSMANPVGAPAEGEDCDKDPVAADGGSGYDEDDEDEEHQQSQQLQQAEGWQSDRPHSAIHSQEYLGHSSPGSGSFSYSYSSTGSSGSSCATESTGAAESTGSCSRSVSTSLSRSGSFFNSGTLSSSVEGKGPLDAGAADEKPGTETPTRRAGHRHRHHGHRRRHHRRHRHVHPPSDSAEDAILFDEEVEEVKEGDETASTATSSDSSSLMDDRSPLPSTAATRLINQSFSGMQSPAHSGSGDRVAAAVQSLSPFRMEYSPAEGTAGAATAFQQQQQQQQQQLAAAAVNAARMLDELQAMPTMEMTQGDFYPNLNTLAGIAYDVEDDHLTSTASSGSSRPWTQRGNGSRGGRGRGGYTNPSGMMPTGAPSGYCGTAPINAPPAPSQPQQRSGYLFPKSSATGARDAGAANHPSPYGAPMSWAARPNLLSVSPTNTGGGGGGWRSPGTAMSPNVPSLQTGELPLSLPQPSQQQQQQQLPPSFAVPLARPPPPPPPQQQQQQAQAQAQAQRQTSFTTTDTRRWPGDNPIAEPYASNNASGSNSAPSTAGSSWYSPGGSPHGLSGGGGSDQRRGPSSTVPPRSFASAGANQGRGSPPPAPTAPAPHSVVQARGYGPGAAPTHSRPPYQGGSGNTYDYQGYTGAAGGNTRNWSSGTSNNLNNSNSGINPDFLGFTFDAHQMGQNFLGNSGNAPETDYFGNPTSRTNTDYFSREGGNDNGGGGYGGYRSDAYRSHFAQPQQQQQQQQPTSSSATYGQQGYANPGHSPHYNATGHRRSPQPQGQSNYGVGYNNMVHNAYAEETTHSPTLSQHSSDQPSFGLGGDGDHFQNFSFASPQLLQAYYAGQPAAPSMGNNQPPQQQQQQQYPPQPQAPYYSSSGYGHGSF